MRGRVLFILSLMANLVLATGWFWTAHRNANRLSRSAIVPVLEAPTPQIRTNLLIRKQFFSWQEVESDDYPAYIANLRDIGCPEQTVRDIIIADVNGLYSRKRATEIVTPEQQWWRAEPDTDVVQLATTKSRELDGERRDLLSRLLGPNWEGGDLVSLPRPMHPSVLLDGPVLGGLPNDVKQAIQQINARSQDRLTTYIEAQRAAGHPPDPVELAKFRQQTRYELAGALSPAQLEEFLLRYSQNANSLRTELGRLKYFDATADEFRALFRATDSFDQQLALLADSGDPNTAAQRRSFEEQRTAAIKNALGPQRSEQFQRLQDAGYRDAFEAAQLAGQPESASTLLELNLASQQEAARIRGQTNLSPEQIRIELKKAELKQLEATAQALGQVPVPEPEPPPKPPPAKIHTLRNGESLDFLAHLYGVKPNDLRAANPSLDFTKLKAGDSVRVPLSLLFPPFPGQTEP